MIRLHNVKAYPLYQKESKTSFYFLIILWIMHHLIFPPIALWAKRLMWNVADSFFPHFLPNLVPCQFSPTTNQGAWRLTDASFEACEATDSYLQSLDAFLTMKTPWESISPQISILVKQFFRLLMFSKLAQGWVRFNLCQIHNCLQSQAWDIIFKNIMLC